MQHQKSLYNQALQVYKHIKKGTKKNNSTKIALSSAQQEYHQNETRNRIQSKLRYNSESNWHPRLSIQDTTPTDNDSYLCLLLQR